MSIASEITRLQGCKSDIRSALVNKGITSASTHNMADFATDISNITAGGATITVTYDSSSYNKTITCSNGSKTYTKTTTSSGSTEFSVSDEGTWTITCNGVSRTVNVVLNYTTQMAITKTVTVYGAAGATISYTDTTGSKTVTLNSSGQGSASITFIPPSQVITFTDTNVSKNPNNLTQNYSKSITITEGTTSIKVIPDGALYWYGWMVDDWTIPPSVATTSSKYFNSTSTTTTKNVNYIESSNTSNANTCAVSVGYVIRDLTNLAKIRALVTDASRFSGNNYFADIRVYNKSNIQSNGTISGNNTVARTYITSHAGTADYTELLELDLTSLTNEYILLIGGQSDGSGRTKISNLLHFCIVE